MKIDEGEAPSPRNSGVVPHGDSKWGWRLRAYPLALLIGMGIGFLIFVFASRGAVGLWGRLGGDYPAFYAAGRLVLDGRVAEIYSFKLQQAQQSDLFPGAEGKFLPYVYPPFVAYAYAPLAMLPYRWSYAVHTALVIAALFAALTLMEPMVPAIRANRALAFAAALLFYPMLRAIFGSQNTAVTILLLVAIWRARKSHRDSLCGCCVALLLYKPQFGVIFVGLFLLERRWRIIVAMITTIAVLYLIGVPTLGARWPIWWFTDVVSAYRAQDQVLNFDASISWLSLAEAIFGAGGPIARGSGLTASLLTAAIVAWTFLRGSDLDIDQRMSLAASAALLISPHTMFYDAGILLIPLGVAHSMWGRRAIPLLACAWIVAWTQALSRFVHFAPMLPMVIAVAIVSWMMVRTSRANLQFVVNAPPAEAAG